MGLFDKLEDKVKAAARDVQNAFEPMHERVTDPGVKTDVDISF